MTVHDWDGGTGFRAADRVRADDMRADVYRLLALMLMGPPSGGLLSLVGGLSGDGTPLGRAFDDLAARARAAEPHAAEREFNALFIGVVQGELVPYASYYRTGFLSDRPLAALRSDLQALGLERADGVSEPEDHIAALCDVMAVLIREGAERAVQRHMFDSHLAPWAGRFFRDLEAADSADLYRPVGTIGRLFLEVEREAADLDDPELEEAEA
ncbi:TorD/DmsD family molecular chaperone [Azospirillum picis]|uniref:TorA maturation chaperone TorD n=1 Tax=Azospirillum picis TaxID=488438 RepID=A0ABU0MDI9_9PROT|nr:molecular chaperone TorD family protein [Azospirillum picis]MBP2297474.1 TorA maturation chaperone TorD [Azospirillum picis]MDQ0531503.1 TorA maturation chaperone TorD [Azospirillum picis]